MTSSRPQALLRWTFLASLILAILPAGFAVQYSRTWAFSRAGHTLHEQRHSLIGVPWFKRAFVVFVTRLKRTVPPDARILVEPSSADTVDGSARWYMFLNYYAYPMKMYVRWPHLASGTLVDYPRWLQKHKVLEDSEAALETLLAVQEEEDAVEEAIEARDIEWRIRLAISRRFEVSKVEISKRVDGEWVPWKLAPLEPVAPSRRRRRR